MTFFLLLTFFILGLIIGSFLNVVICRFNTQKTFGGRSACFSCRTQLCWYELIPLFSFLGLGGRCKNCKTKISIQYPLVELTTGFIFALLFLKFEDIFWSAFPEFAFSYAYYAFGLSVLFVISVYDLKHKIIPDRLSFIFGALAFLGLFLFSSYGLIELRLPSILEILWGPLIATPFALFWLVSRGRWMGLGDAKLALGLGWFLGMPLALSALTLAFWTGAAVGLFLIVSKKGYGMKTEIPFALYLALGTFVVFFFELNLFSF